MQHHLRRHASTIYNSDYSVFDKDYFLHGLAMQVAEYRNSAYVRLLTYGGGDYLVRDVVKTYEGAVSLNAWLDSAGVAPIVSGSSQFPWVRRLNSSPTASRPSVVVQTALCPPPTEPASRPARTYRR